jgi:hypothetical protein
MASYRIVEVNGPYTKIAVEFAGHEFEQIVMLSDPAALQAYADEYEAAFAALPLEQDD